MQCQRDYPEIGLMGTGRSGNYCVVQQKIHVFSATNYAANLYSATILLISTLLVLVVLRVSFACRASLESLGCCRLLQTTYPLVARARS